MNRKMIAILTGLCALAVVTMASSVRAADNLNGDILRVALDWEHIKFEVSDKNAQEQQMAKLAERASALSSQYQGRPEAQIWYGIILSEQASMAGENGSPFKALGFAKHAREILEPIADSNPAVLDAGAPTSLGVLYYRVPGFPIGFGDKTKARHLLEEAVKYAPDGLDANYFYGDFLLEQKEYAAAASVFKHALTSPPHPERPLWDKSRRLVIEQDLAKIPSN
jgi:tetratricopeptide (TPR) repeat protein